MSFLVDMEYSSPPSAIHSTCLLIVMFKFDIHACSGDMVAASMDLPMNGRW